MKNLSHNSFQAGKERLNRTPRYSGYPASDLLTYAEEPQDMPDDQQDKEEETERDQDNDDIQGDSVYPEEHIHEEYADNNGSDTHHCRICQPLNDTNV